MGRDQAVVGGQGGELVGGADEGSWAELWPGAAATRSRIPDGR